MAVILNIDTAVLHGSVCLSQNGKPLQIRQNENQREHASWIHGAIKEMMTDADFEMKDLQAVAVSNGPGSYTGLRIGLAAAKGLCYGLQIPLITISTLKIMAAALLTQPVKELIKNTDWLCPLVDARRLEAWFAVFAHDLSVVYEPALLSDPEILMSLQQKNRIIFFGNGSLKFRKKMIHKNALFTEFIHQNAFDMAPLSYQLFLQTQFSDTAYAEPFYGKGFYSPPNKIKD